MEPKRGSEWRKQFVLLGNVIEDLWFRGSISPIWSDKHIFNSLIFLVDQHLYIPRLQLRLVSDTAIASCYRNGFSQLYGDVLFQKVQQIQASDFPHNLLEKYLNNKNTNKNHCSIAKFSAGWLDICSILKKKQKQ